MTRFKHGGKRKGAGRKSVFSQKADSKAIAMCFTPAGHRALTRLQRKLKVSRNGVIGRLAEACADGVAFEAAGVAYPGKTREVLSIRLPRAIGAKLRAARRRTGKSFSDIGESLVRLGADLVRKGQWPLVVSHVPPLDTEPRDDRFATISGHIGGEWNGVHK